MFRRSAFILCIVLSFPAVASVILYARSYRVTYEMEFVKNHELWRISVSRGRLGIDNLPQLALERELTNLHQGEIRRADKEYQNIQSRLLKFPLRNFNPSPRRIDPEFEFVYNVQFKNNERRLDGLISMTPTPSKPVSHSLPLASIILGLIAPVGPAFFRRKFVLRHRRLHGLCTHCGYDLRGGQTRCPECGTDASSQFGPGERKNPNCVMKIHL